MFPNLRKHSKNGYAHQLGQWFQLFNRLKITDNPRKSFHSIRHAFTDELKQAGVDSSIIAELIGHSHTTLTMSRYGKRFGVRILLDAISKLQY
ncbi:MAG: tyrosine-type recombinase/integrase [Candidatus Riflebacteria bacterium]|nr:tyrosine-type recombinase/integrase [Candidatus Riflebacteria bacterium]